MPPGGRVHGGDEGLWQADGAADPAVGGDGRAGQGAEEPGDLPCQQAGDVPLNLLADRLDHSSRISHLKNSLMRDMKYYRLINWMSVHVIASSYS